MRILPSFFEQNPPREPQSPLSLAGRVREGGHRFATSVKIVMSGLIRDSKTISLRHVPFLLDAFASSPRKGEGIRAALVFTLLSLFLFGTTPAHALSSNWQRDGAVDVRLIAGLEGVGQQTTIPLGLEVKMEPGWHTYWRSPGIAGLPPQFDWSKSENDESNFRKATILYPAPKRYNDKDLETIGYQSHVIFPIDVELRQPGHPLVIDTTLNLLACALQCVPKTYELRLTVPADAAIEGPEADVLNPVRAALPGSDEEHAGLAIKNITNKGSKLMVEISAREPLQQPDLFVESDPEIPFGAPVTQIAPDKRSAIMTLTPLDSKQDLATLADTPLTLTVVDENHALQMAATLPPLPTVTMPTISLRLALLLAIAGGFILNLMPCVLPVLSLKIMGLLGHGGSDVLLVRRSFLTTAAGIMFSFLLLAGMTVLVKKLGLTLGWGVQFQQPLFLIALILVLTFFAANLWGLFAIGLPPFVTSRLSEHHPKMAGDFATGALATLLATPCSAPFLGTAISFALAAGTTREIVGIFVALGFGMTLPYLTIAAIPELATLLPKPGAWMVRLRFLLGIMLAATAAWLLWVLSAEIPLRYAVTIALCLIGIVVVLGIHAAGIARRVAFACLLGFTVIAVCLALYGAPDKKQGDSLNLQWEMFDEVALAEQVAAGHTVFVDITAAWCVTCKTNKKFVLSDEDIQKRLFHSDVIAMQGDWTNPDPAISAFLHEFKRYGIPFDVVYGPGAPHGITLPELLTHDDVVEALDRAGKR